MSLCIKEGYAASNSGATSVVAISLGSGTSFDVSAYDGYQDFTVSNFRISSVSESVSGSFYVNHEAVISGTGRASAGSLSMSYDANRGVLTINGSSQNVSILTNPVPGDNSNISLTITRVPTVELLLDSTVYSIAPASKTLSGTQDYSDRWGNTYTLSGSATVEASIVNGAIRLAASGQARCVSNTYRAEFYPDGWTTTDKTTTLA